MPKLKLADLVAAESTTPPWLIPDFLARGSLVVLAGDAGVGKTVLGDHLALACAAGLPALHFPAQQPMRVLIVDQENSLPDAQEYLLWAWRGLGCPDVPLIDSNLHIEHFGIRGAWHEHLRGLVSAVQPDLVLIDTATPVFQIIEENSNSEASRAIAHLRSIQANSSPSPTIIVYKHAKVITEPGHPRTIRGAKAWLNESDSVIFHIARPGRPRSDGLRETALEPHKTRAFGLRYKVRIEPQWTVLESGHKGLKLTAS